MGSVNIYDLFSTNVVALEETSFDDANKVYMTSLSTKVVNFDKVKDDYRKSRQFPAGSKPKSCDALFQSNDELYFIEFRNSQSGRNVVKPIKEKVFASLLIFSDITKNTLSELVQYTNFILVYNEVLNNPRNENPTTTIPASPFINSFIKDLSGLAAVHVPRFGFDCLQGFCFKHVFTFTPKELEEYMSLLKR